MGERGREGWLWMLLAVCGYASFPVLAKLLYRHSELAPLEIASWRFLLATPLVWLYLWARRPPWRRYGGPRVPRRHLLLLGAIYSAASLLAFLGLREIPASLYTILFYTYPLLVALLARLLGTRLGRGGWLALALTSLGVLLVLVPDLGGLRPEGATLRGMAIALANATVAALYFLASKHYLRNLRESDDLARAVGWTMLTIAILMLVVSLFVGLRAPASAASAVLLLALAVSATALPILALNIGIQRLGAAHAAIIAMMEPFLTLLLAAFLLSETLQALQWLGGALILLSVLALEIRNARALRGQSERV